MKKWICVVLVAGFMSLSLFAKHIPKKETYGKGMKSTNDSGYFLSFKQKGELIWFGQIQDNKRIWYNILIVPGYKPPVLKGWQNIKKAGNNLHEYGESKKYKKLWNGSKDCFEWAFDDCFYDFTFNGSGRVWKKYFGRAKKRVSKKVFGWWLSYPWALMQSSVDNVVRIPLGLVGTIVGTAAGGIFVPSYYLLDSSAKACWNGGIEGVILPTCGWAWNTAVAPPLSLLGQKPSKSRVDGFWIRIVDKEKKTDFEPDEDTLFDITKWGVILQKELDSFEKQRSDVMEDMKEKLKVINDKARIIRQEAEAQNKNIKEAEEIHAQKFVSGSKNHELAEKLRKDNWTRNRIQKYQYLIRNSLKNKGISEKEHSIIIRLLMQYPFTSDTKLKKSSTNEKADPVSESIRIIKEID